MLGCNCSDNNVIGGYGELNPVCIRPAKVGDVPDGNFSLSPGNTLFDSNNATLYRNWSFSSVDAGKPKARVYNDTFGQWLYVIDTSQSSDPDITALNLGTAYSATSDILADVPIISNAQSQTTQNTTPNLTPQVEQQEENTSFWDDIPTWMKWAGGLTLAVTLGPPLINAFSKSK